MIIEIRNKNNNRLDGFIIPAEQIQKYKNRKPDFNEQDLLMIINREIEKFKDVPQIVNEIVAFRIYEHKYSQGILVKFIYADNLMVNEIICRDNCQNCFIKHCNFYKLDTWFEFKNVSDFYEALIRLGQINPKGKISFYQLGDRILCLFRGLNNIQISIVNEYGQKTTASEVFCSEYAKIKHENIEIKKYLPQK